MSDRGLSIQELLVVRCITLNGPTQKENGQFADRDVATNFDIASSRMYVALFIEREGNWEILNSILPINRIGILSSTWQTLAHIVNLTNAFIGPKK